jgi:hypothetical protein
VKTIDNHTRPIKSSPSQRPFHLGSRLVHTTKGNQPQKEDRLRVLRELTKDLQEILDMKDVLNKKMAIGIILFFNSAGKDV